METKLKDTLRKLHDELGHHGPLDEESQDLLRRLEVDIRRVLEEEPESDESNTYGLAERSQELSARFAARHPRLEPTLRELTRILGNIGV